MWQPPPAAACVAALAWFDPEETNGYCRGSKSLCDGTFGYCYPTTAPTHLTPNHGDPG